MIINKKLTKPTEKTFRRKNTTFGVKFKFLGRVPSGALLGTDNAINRCASIVFLALFKRGINVKNVFFKEETLDFFIETERDLISMNSLDKDWINQYKRYWGRTFHNITVGQYTVYEDQYTNITDKVGELVQDYEEGITEPVDIWFLKEYVEQKELYESERA